MARNYHHLLPLLHLRKQLLQFLLSYFQLFALYQ
jgi:hypothetical protein